MPVVLLVDVSVRTRLCLLLLLFFTLILSQSRLGIALFVISSALFYCMDKQIKKNWKFIIPALIFVVVSAVYVLYNLDALVVRFSYVARFYYEFDYYLTESKRASEWISLADTDLVPLFLGQPMGNTAEFYESEWAGAFARVGVLGAFWIFAIGVVALRALQQSVKLRLSSHIWLGCVLVSHVWVYCLASAGISRWKVGFVFLSLLAMLCSGVAKRNNRDSVQRIVS
ncbi:hypothetical protein ACH42_01165 [Endozoicomonas sp. (ex Bugula neritina AB1)]|nr:hypothetical protein ACH42_01165 [Endozoicomonas sp. (ex Bugula neritina AB1)]